MCPVRITENGELFGLYSPIFRHHLPRSIDSNPLNSSAQISNRHSSFDTIDGSPQTIGRSSALVKRVTHRYSRPLTDQQKALLFMVIIMILAAFCTALLKHWCV